MIFRLKCLYLKKLKPNLKEIVNRNIKNVNSSNKRRNKNFLTKWNNKKNHPNQANLKYQWNRLSYTKNHKMSYYHKSMNKRVKCLLNNFSRNLISMIMWRWVLSQVDLKNSPKFNKKQSQSFKLVYCLFYFRE